MLPCPFCGGEAQVWFDESADQRHFHHWVAGCRHQPPPGCSVEPDTCDNFRTKEAAVSAWNRRAATGNAELRSALQRIVEEAKPKMLQLGNRVVASDRISTVPTSAIEAASKVLKRTED